MRSYSSSIWIIFSFHGVAAFRLSKKISETMDFSCQMRFSGKDFKRFPVSHFSAIQYCRNCSAIFSSVGIDSAIEQISPAKSFASISFNTRRIAALVSSVAADPCFLKKDNNRLLSLCDNSCFKTDSIVSIRIKTVSADCSGS